MKLCWSLQWNYYDQSFLKNYTLEAPITVHISMQMVNVCTGKTVTFIQIW